MHEEFLLLHCPERGSPFPKMAALWALHISSSGSPDLPQPCPARACGIHVREIHLVPEIQGVPDVAQENSNNNMASLRWIYKGSSANYVHIT